MKILPFRGFRYNPAKISKLDDVISPPYDQFREGLDDLLYQRHPYNIARIIMNKEMAQDSATDNRYTRSKALLDRWVQEKVFLQDLQPGIYPYFQDFQVRGQSLKTRKGFVALGEITEYSQRIVLPHERTLAKPKQDRLNLLRATLADTGLIFMLYSDPQGKIEAMLGSLTSRQPDMVALDLNQERNRLWKVDNSGAIEELRQAMQDKTVIIADGHHRYEVALDFRRETALRITKAKEWELYGYKLMSFVRLESEGITILPIHRLIHSVIHFNPSEFLRRLPEFFAIQELPIVENKKLSVLEILMDALKKQQLAGNNAFGLYLPALHKFALLKFDRDSAHRISWPADKTQTWRKLDVSVLQVVILGHLLGIGERQLSEQTNLEYVSHHTEAIQMTDEKSFQCAFLLNPTPIEHVKEVVEAGDILPQKSTHFHPKLMEGLVFAKHVSPRGNNNPAQGCGPAATLG
jgi:uncharacterized protein (DUF1015 family)